MSPNPVAMALRAGEFSLHHELAVHRSAPNNASATGGSVSG